MSEFIDFNDLFADGIDKGIDNIVASLDSLSASLKRFNKNSEKIDAFSKALNALAVHAEGLKNVSDEVTKLNENLKNIGRAPTKLNSLAAGFERLSSTAINLKNFVGEVEKLIGNLNTLYSIKRKDVVSVSKAELKRLKDAANSINENTEALGKSKDALNEAEKAQIRLDKERERARQIIDAQGESILALESKLKSLVLEYKSLDKNSENYEKTAKSLATEIQTLNKQISSQTAVLRKNNTSLINSITSYDAMSAGLREAKEELRAMENAFDPLTGELNMTNEAAVQLVEKIKQMDASLKTFDKSIGESFREVGNYEQAVRNAIDASAIFGESSEKLGGILDGVRRTYTVITGAMEKQEDGQRALTVAWKKYIEQVKKLGGIKITGVLALAVAVAALVSKFKQTETGGRQLQKVIITITAVVNVLISRLAMLGEALVLQFSAIHKGFNAVMFGITGEFKKAAQAGKGATKDMQGAAAQLAGAFSGLGGAVSQAIAEYQKIFKLQHELAINTRELEVQIAKLNKEYELLNIIASDNTISLQKQAKAEAQAALVNERALMLTIRLRQQELEIANRRLNQAVKEGNATSELRDAQKDAVIALIASEKDLANFQRETQQRQRDIRGEIAEEGLNYELDLFDAQKTVAERLIALERTTQAERRAIIAESRKLADISFEQQKQEIEVLSEKRLDLNKILKMSNREALEEVRAAGLSKDINDRVLEILRERIFLLQDLADLETDTAEIEKDRISRLKNAERGLLEFQLQAAIDRQTLLIKTGGATGKALLAQVATRDKLMRDLEDFRLQQSLKAADSELDLLEKHRQEDIVRAEGSQEEILKINKFYDQERLDLEKIILREKELLILESNKRVADIEKQGIEERLQNRIEGFKRFKEIENQVTDFVFSALDQRNQARLVKIDEQLNASRAQKDNELAIAGENEEAIKTIEMRAIERERNLQREKDRILRQQARLKKAATINNIILDTTQAVVASLAPPPVGAGPILGIPLSIATAAFGAAKLAVALALPAFAKGTKSSPEGPALVSEKGYELAVDPHGKLALTPDKPAIVNLEAGTRIYDHETTKQMLNNSLTVDEKKNNGMEDVLDRLVMRDAEILKAVDNMRFFQFVQNKKGFQSFILNKSGRTEMINNRYK